MLMSSIHPSIILCRAEFVESYCVNLVLPWNILVSTSTVIESFARYASLGWQSLRVCKTSAQDILTFIVFGKKSRAILIGLPYTLFDISPLLLLIFSLVHSMFLLLSDRRNFFSRPVCLGFCGLLVCSWASLSLG